MKRLENEGLKNDALTRKQSRDLTSGSLPRHLWALALPMIIANVLQNAFSIVDMIFVGRLGPVAVASVAVSGLAVGSNPM